MRFNWLGYYTYHPIHAVPNKDIGQLDTDDSVFSEYFVNALANRPPEPRPVEPVYLPAAQVQSPPRSLPKKLWEAGKHRRVWKERFGYTEFTGPYSRIQSLLWRMVQGKTYGNAYYTVEHGTETGILRKSEKEKFRLSVRKRIFNDIWLFFLDKVAIEGAFWKTQKDIEGFFNKEIATRFAWICVDAVADRKSEADEKADRGLIRFRRLSENELLDLYRKVHDWVRGRFTGDICIYQEDARGELILRLKNTIETEVAPVEDVGRYINKSIGNMKKDYIQNKDGDLIHLYRGNRARDPQGSFFAPGPWWKVAGRLGPNVRSNWLSIMHGMGGASPPSEDIEEDIDSLAFLRAASEPNETPDTSGDSGDEKHRDGWLEGLQAIQQRAFRNQGPLPFLDDVHDEHNHEDALHLTNWKLQNRLIRPEESWIRREFLVKLFAKDHEGDRQEFQAQLSKEVYPTRGGYRKGGPKPMPMPLPKNPEKKLGAYRQARVEDWTLDEIRKFRNLPRGHLAALKARGCVPPASLNDTDVRRLNQFLYDLLHEWGYTATTIRLRSDRLARALYSPIKEGDEEIKEKVRPTIGNNYHRGKFWGPERKYTGIWKKHMDLSKRIHKPEVWEALKKIDLPEHLNWVRTYWLPETQGGWDALTSLPARLNT